MMMFDHGSVFGLLISRVGGKSGEELRSFRVRPWNARDGGGQVPLQTPLLPLLLLSTS